VQGNLKDSNAILEHALAIDPKHALALNAKRQVAALQARNQPVVAVVQGTAVQYD
jgi:hypothetical protein